ncbi:MAG TPA: hypothetical protein VEG38_08245 [Acidimicrobiia bacterium]|nr:hypothetical protein [Acidimicrobiia bacterium]
MRHPTEGVLRRLLDEPAGVADTDRRHVAACQECLARLATVRQDADLVAAALAVGADADADADPAAAWSRLSRTASAPGRVRTAPPRQPGRVRTALRRPLVVGVAVAAVMAGAGAAAANDWLPIFRTERIAPVSLTTEDLNALPDLRQYGDVVVSGDPNVHPVAGAAAAAESGLDVPEVTDLPRGVSGEPAYQVGDEITVTFTFSAERAARAAADAGETPPAPPPGLDGTRVRLVAGPGVAGIWSGSAGVPDLIVGRAVAPRAFSSSGVPFETLRDYLLSVPGLPRDVAASLRTLNADGSTLPLPVPTDRFTTSSTRLDGVPATVLAARNRSMAAVAWVKDGLLTVVAGPLDADEVLSVARSLR